MATRFARVTRAFGAILVLTTLAACVAPQHRYYGGGGGGGGGGYGRSYAYQQPVHRGGGYNPGWRGGHQRGWR